MTFATTTYNPYLVSDTQINSSTNVSFQYPYEIYDSTLRSREVRVSYHWYVICVSASGKSGGQFVINNPLVMTHREQKGAETPTQAPQSLSELTDYRPQNIRFLQTAFDAYESKDYIKAKSNLYLFTATNWKKEKIEEFTENLLLTGNCLNRDVFSMRVLNQFQL